MKLLYILLYVQIIFISCVPFGRVSRYSVQDITGYFPGSDWTQQWWIMVGRLNTNNKSYSFVADYTIIKINDKITNVYFMCNRDNQSKCEQTYMDFLGNITAVSNYNGFKLSYQDKTFNASSSINTNDLKILEFNHQDKTNNISFKLENQRGIVAEGLNGMIESPDITSYEYGFAGLNVISGTINQESIVSGRGADVEPTDKPDDPFAGFTLAPMPNCSQDDAMDNTIRRYSGESVDCEDCREQLNTENIRKTSYSVKGNSWGYFHVLWTERA